MDFVVPLLTGSEEYLHVERFICIELLLHWLETQLFLVLLRYIHAISHLSF